MSRMFFEREAHEGSLCRARRDRGVCHGDVRWRDGPRRGKAASGDHCTRAVQPHLVWQVRAHAATGRAIKSDSGTGTATWTSREVTRDGAKVGISIWVTTLEGKRGTLVIRERMEDVEAGNGHHRLNRHLEGRARDGPVRPGHRRRVVGNVVVERTRSLVRPPRRPAQRSVSAARDGAACARASPRRTAVGERTAERKR